MARQHVVQFRVTEEEEKRLKADAAAAGTSVSELCRQRSIRDVTVIEILRQILQGVLAIQRYLADEWVKRGS